MPAPDLDAALSFMEARGRELAASADGQAVDLKVRRIEPVQRVIARLELHGPRRLSAGVDVRGDGSAEAYTGRLRRQVMEQGVNQTPYQALRKALEG